MEGNGPKAGRGRCAGEGGERHRFRAKAGQQKSGWPVPRSFGLRTYIVGRMGVKKLTY